MLTICFPIKSSQMNPKIKLGTAIFTFALIVGFATMLVESTAEHLNRKNVNTN